MTRDRRSLIWLFLFLVSVAVHSGTTASAAGLPVSQVAKLLALDGDLEDEFGKAVAISGDTAVIGAADDDDAGVNSGAAYVFTRNAGAADQWDQVAKLVPADLEPIDNFGYAVAISGDIVIVGSIGDDDAGPFSGSGSSYIFGRNQGGPDNWGEIAKLVPSDPEANDMFGRAVAISGDTAVVGSADDDGGNNSGAVYLFTRNQGGADNWGEVTKLTASDAAPNGRFGESVALSGETVLVSAHGIDHTTVGGAAYIFERNQGGADNWGQVAKLQSSDGAPSDSFGEHVDLCGDTAVISAHNNDDDGQSSGSAYVFARNLGGADNWGEVAKLTASDAMEYTYFGISVGLETDTIIVGATAPQNGGAGSVYVFARNQGGADNWGEIQKLGDTVGYFPNGFGWAVGISDESIVIGDYGDPSAGLSSGAAYIFMPCGAAPREWNERLEIHAADLASGDYFGTDAALSGDTLIVGATGDQDLGNYSGSAYIFAKNQGTANGWGQVAKLTASDGATNDNFGVAVGISGGTAVVGSFNESSSGTNSGAAYVYERNQGGADIWGEATKLTAADAAAQDRFGEAVDIDRDLIVVGAPYDSDAGSGTGAAYIFARNQGGADAWGQVAKLTASDAAGVAFFGNSVAISGDIALIGSPQAQVGGVYMGAAYVFARNQGGADHWGQVVKIEAADGQAGDYFGRYVALERDTAAIGAIDDDDLGSDSGSAYLFNRNQGGADNWGQVTKVMASDGAASEGFGSRVALTTERLIVGSPGSSGYLGAAYVFNRNQGGADTWGEVVKLTSSDAAVGENFGKITAIGSAGAFITTPYNSDFASAAGSIYFFDNECITYDFGDAPDPGFPTLLSADGARHRMGGNTFMGTLVDEEIDGQPTSDATGDDTDPEGDDEDGVTFTTSVVAGETGGVDVVASQICLLDAWIDFNDDGDWDDPSEKVFTDEPLVVGPNSLIFTVPVDTSPGSDVNARFRVSTVGGLSYTGEAADGEVEDHQIFIEELDFGDAPDPTFPTLLASDGARHILGGPLFLGALVDSENDGLPSASASGDDTNNLDDEDGVDFGMAPIGGSATGTVFASAAGFLNGWIDFNGNGDWSDPGEQVFTDYALAAGTNAVSIPVPPTALPGQVLARYRVNSTGGLSPTGLAQDGEVEDHPVLIVEIDYGDAPDPTYPTLRSSDGAYHLIVSGNPYLGASIDSDIDGQPNASAEGDDTDGSDDEDGVVFSTGLGAGLDAAVDVTASDAGFLNAWVDFNRDGDWDDAGEQIFTDRTLATGVNALSFAVPPGATLGTSFARFRFDSAGGLSFDGFAADGEVEDYMVEIVEGPDLEITMVTSSETAPSGLPLTYTITVTNNGPLPATSVTVTDTLPGELTFVSSTPGTPDCTFASDTLTCDLGTMAPTDTTQITVETVLDHPVYGTISNTSSVAAAELDPISANNTTTVDTLIALFVDGFESGDLSAWD